jgi:hypothetical protein
MIHSLFVKNSGSRDLMETSFGLRILHGVLNVALVLLLAPLFEGIQLSDYTGRRLLMVAGVTFVLATIDTLLESVLPLPLDAELADL